MAAERSHGLQRLRLAASLQLSRSLHTLFLAPGNNTGNTGCDVRAGGRENTTWRSEVAIATWLVSRAPPGLVATLTSEFLIPK